MTCLACSSFITLCSPALSSAERVERDVGLVVAERLEVGLSTVAERLVGLPPAKLRVRRDSWALAAAELLVVAEGIIRELLEKTTQKSLLPSFSPSAFPRPHIP